MKIFSYMKCVSGYIHWDHYFTIARMDRPYSCIVRNSPEPIQQIREFTCSWNRDRNLHWVCLKATFLQSHLSYYSTRRILPEFRLCQPRDGFEVNCSKDQFSNKRWSECVSTDRQLAGIESVKWETTNIPEKERKQKRRQETCKPILKLEPPPPIIPDYEIKQEVHDENLCYLQT
jgi:hypothetical protein